MNTQEVCNGTIANNGVCLKCFHLTASSSGKCIRLISTPLEEGKPSEKPDFDEIIMAIYVNSANFDHISRVGRIQGSLLVSLRVAMEKVYNLGKRSDQSNKQDLDKQLGIMQFETAKMFQKLDDANQTITSLQSEVERLKAQIAAQEPVKSVEGDVDINGIPKQDLPPDWDYLK